LKRSLATPGGNFNTATGSQALANMNGDNTADGALALNQNTDGHDNGWIATKASAAAAETSSPANAMRSGDKVKV